MYCLLDADNKAPPPASTSPSVNPLEEKTIAGFTNGRPLDDKVDTVQCKHCRRPVLRASAASHIRECLNKKQEKLKKKKEAKEAKDAALRKEKGEDDDSGIGARKSAIKGAMIDGEGAKKGKKRKIEDGAEKGPNAKKKKKDEPKAKGAKPKGPVDVERQCGVPLPNGGFCARSLTCKSHSMGLKRAVPGRSLPYDMLLAQYQKKNQAKQQRMIRLDILYNHHKLTLSQVLRSMRTRLSLKISSPLAQLTLMKKKTASWLLLHDIVLVPSRPTHTSRSALNTNTFA
jgi:SAGA-associated factor 73